MIIKSKQKNVMKKHIVHDISVYIHKKKIYTKLIK